MSDILKFGSVACPVLANNLRDLQAQEIFDIDINSLNQEAFKRKLESISLLGIYDDIYQKLFSDHNIPENQYIEGRDIIEQAAIAYMGMSRTQIVREMLVNTETILNQIEAVSVKLADLIDAYSADLDIVSKLTNWDAGSNQHIGELLKFISSDLTNISSIKKKLRDTDIAQLSEMGKQSPKSNMAIIHWAHMMYIFWTRELKRTLVNLNDGINGRKHLLNFMIDCMLPLHEAIEANTIDNSLRKVQKILASGSERLF